MEQSSPPLNGLSCCARLSTHGSGSYHWSDAASKSLTDLHSLHEGNLWLEIEESSEASRALAPPPGRRLPPDHRPAAACPPDHRPPPLPPDHRPACLCRTTPVPASASCPGPPPAAGPPSRADRLHRGLPHRPPYLPPDHRPAAAYYRRTTARLPLPARPAARGLSHTNSRAFPRTTAWAAACNRTSDRPSSDYRWLPPSQTIARPLPYSAVEQNCPCSSACCRTPGPRALSPDRRPAVPSTRPPPSRCLQPDFRPTFVGLPLGCRRSPPARLQPDLRRTIARPPPAGHPYDHLQTFDCLSKSL
ncbi:proline-rich receptor-like protein kinase PERK10 [Dendrobium catenatum]|uniref:proline-rich receptor-like protein kinase PERK10 n=1 Tax=Dendrobium catenatum TaxID=906689 RepID=UPI00109FBF28|nr:proline-rich receptor-like protein kinase PERK10 [Dendrobium catenatum]